MYNWRHSILKKFVSDVSKLTLVSDSDSLLTEEELARSIKERGFELIEFNDPIEFRYFFESKFRSNLDQGEKIDIVAIFNQSNIELHTLPYDIIQAGKIISINIGEIFPKLSYPIVKQLDYNLFDTLFEAQMIASQERLGENLTKNFILLHVFKIDSKLITNDVELLHSLLQLHYGSIKLPSVFVERLIELLNNCGKFDEWPLQSIVSNSGSFFSFLQERWPIFLEKTGSSKINTNTSTNKLKLSGPNELPFDHPKIRVYIDNLFVERKLIPVVKPESKAINDSWILSGISTTDIFDEDLRISRLIELIEGIHLSLCSNHSDWIFFAKKWAELSALIYSQHCSQGNIEKYNALSLQTHKLFTEWLHIKYSFLVSLPPTSPVMLHHVPRHLARELECHVNSKIALIVIDGLSLDQWVTVRNILNSQCDNFCFDEEAVFAWIPTITSVSRQALFSGKPPYNFPSTIYSTNNESKFWQQLWQSQGVNQNEIVFMRGLGDGNPVNVLDSMIDPSSTKIIGLVINKIDEIMHGIKLGSEGMHNQIKQWCERKFLVNLLIYLLHNDFKVWITSDHGNIESKGRGRPTEGDIADNRGERVRIYPSTELRSQVSSKLEFPTILWQPIGLPDKFFPLIANGNDAFVNKGESIVSHGGLAIEEVIVPYVNVSRSD